MSLFSKIVESRQFKKMLVAANSPLEFARKTVRHNGDVSSRSRPPTVILADIGAKTQVRHEHVNDLDEPQFGGHAQRSTAIELTSTRASAQSARRMPT